ncbi:MAG TPA: hypothetical protein VNX70_15415 [Bryobacteraceae bacterium]|nr:hypothetical protein [Bryobacteraceae bacterium]
MGQEINCRVDFSGQSSEGIALLETSEIVFRGTFRLKIPFQAITALEAAKGKLSVQYRDGQAVFHIGKAADKWAGKIRHPPSRLDKLGVKPGTKVYLIGRHDDDFRRELTERGAVLSSKKPDLVFLSIKEKDQLVELAYLLESPVWIIYPKGIQTITQGDVITAGRAAGFVDIKVCGFSATHTALKFKPRR